MPPSPWRSGGESRLSYRLVIRGFGTISALAAVYFLTIRSYYIAAFLVMLALENVIELAILYAAKELGSQKDTSGGQS